MRRLFAPQRRAYASTNLPKSEFRSSKRSSPPPAKDAAPRPLVNRELGPIIPPAPSSRLSRLLSPRRRLPPQQQSGRERSHEGEPTAPSGGGGGGGVATRLRAAARSAQQLIWLACTLGVFAHVVWADWFRPVGPWGASMLPTMYLSGEWLVLDVRHRRGRGVAVGDVVSAAHPLFLGEGVLKRVVAMPGDFVLAGTPERSSTMIQVPEGHCFLAGDNQNFSRDSRHYGPIPLALIQGKIIMRIWPPRRIGWIKNSLTAVDVDEAI